MAEIAVIFAAAGSIMNKTVSLFSELLAFPPQFRLSRSDYFPVVKLSHCQLGLKTISEGSPELAAR